MKFIIDIIFNGFRILAMLGGIILLISGPYYFHETIHYGFLHNWHFEHASGWGFRFLATSELVILGLIMITPYWLFVKIDKPIKFLPSRKIINWLASIGILIFLLAIAMETSLQKIFS